MTYSNSLIAYNGIEFTFSRYSRNKDAAIFSSPTFQSPRNGMWMVFEIGQSDETGEIIYSNVKYDGAECPIRETTNIYSDGDVLRFIEDAFRDEICLMENRHDDAFSSLCQLMDC